MKPQLTVETLRSEAATFAEIESAHDEPSLYGVTDGKAVGTYLEHKFQNLLNTSTPTTKAVQRKESISRAPTWI